MNCRDRVIRVLDHKTVDRPAVQYLYTPVGFYEHGEALNDLYEKYPGDFGAFARQPIPVLPKEVFDADGRYFEKKTDEWGVTSEYRVYGIMGHAVGFPIQDLEDAAEYKFPPQPLYVENPQMISGEIANAKKDFFVMQGAGSGILEQLWLLRGFENLMMDLYDDSPEINSFMDRYTKYIRARVEALVAAGAEGIAFGDDYGTQDGLLLSKDIFRKMVKPRLAYMMEPAIKAGLHIHFHSCGRVIELFDDFKDLGIGSIWPQIPAYDMQELADAVRFYNFSLAIHTDRAVTMTHGTPEQVRELVGLENEIFKPKDGGAWFYIEADTGFPFDNIKTLVETVFSL